MMSSTEEKKQSTPLPPLIENTNKKTKKGRSIIFVNGERYVASPLTPVPDRKAYMKAYRADKKHEMQLLKNKLTEQQKQH